MATSHLQQDCDMLDSVCIADAGMRECLSFTGQLSHILLADAAAVYTFRDALTSPSAKCVVNKAKRLVFFVSWLSFECKNAMRAIVAQCGACQDVSVYSALSLPEDDPLMHGLDCTCQYLSYPGRAFELQDVELLLFPSAATSVFTAPLCSRRDEMTQLIAAQLAGGAHADVVLSFVSLTLLQRCVSAGAGSRNSALSMSFAKQLFGQRALESNDVSPLQQTPMKSSTALSWLWTGLRT
jgi:hypothetical protein